jgi:riboflavin kinase / FMN adenylyltransferase
VRLWHGLADVPQGWGRSVVTIGVFDGVHRGHQHILARGVETARRLGLPLVVVTFDPHPIEVVRPGTHPPRLSTPRRRAELLSQLGADAVMVLPFTPEIFQMSPDEFVQSVLVDRLRVAGVVVGENFRFGHKAKGDVALLRELGDKYDFSADGVPLVTDGTALSSTYVRERLSTGDVEGAAVALGRPHRLEGVVVRGHRRGRALGFPTANLQVHPYAAVPADGVYAGWLQRLEPVGAATSSGSPGPPGSAAEDDDASPAEPRWPAAISIGTNPHFGDQERSVEAYALDRDDLELYGERAAIDFAARIRDVARFESLDALIAEMRRDVAKTREITANR